MHKQTFKANAKLSLNELLEIQKNKFKEFIKYVNENSVFYNGLFKKSIYPKTIEDLKKIPVISKETIRKNLNSIYTIKKKQGIISKTGGTTGKSLEVIFTKDDMQERFALLDTFREQFGYKLGKKTAWFSGKSLLTDRDLKKNRFWKTDYYYKVRYYSTFHINEKYLGFYLDDLIKFKPEYMVGFPSSILEIAKFGARHQINFPENVIKAVFPTAEVVTDEFREIMQNYFHTEVYDQYASSEGAPFIFECKNHNLHLELQSGVFEVLDDNNQPAKNGRLVITSFTTKGTPLIRYDIGDNIVLSDKICNCGNQNPLIDKIEGRNDDFIYSEKTGKINLGNISNTLKGVHGIKKFQVIQDKIEEIKILIIVDESKYTEKDKNTFLYNWRERVGDKMKIALILVSDIDNERSGKFRLIKNNIKHLFN